MIRKLPFTLSIIALVAMACSNQKKEAWKSPADQELLGKLEEETLKKGVGKERRAQLFFLWGQELAQQAKAPAKGTTENREDPNESRRRAIGAFEKVIDLSTILADESRFNLELLLKEDRSNQTSQNDKSDQKQEARDQSGQQDQNSRRTDDASGNSDSNKDKGKNESAAPPRGDQSNKGQNANAKEDDSDTSDRNGQSERNGDGEEKDLSGLVKDKDQDSSLDQALQQERARLEQGKEAQSGGVVPVEKDW